MDTTAIETKNLTKHYRRGFGKGVTKALSQLALEVRRGEIYGFLGPNGAGKTTTIKMLMGFIHPTSGEARLLGRPASDVGARRRIGYMPETPYFHDFLTGRQALHFYGSLCGMGGRDIRRRIDQLREMIGLRDELTTPLAKHSKGMLQRIGLAQSLINDAELLILDEPMSGLDPIGRKELRDTILSLRGQGKTVFFSSHILADVELLCDRVGILVRGQMVRSIEMRAFLAAGKTYHIEYTDGPELSAFPGVRSEQADDGRRILKLETAEQRDGAFKQISAAGGHILSAAERMEESLEEVFVREARAGMEGRPK